MCTLDICVVYTGHLFCVHWTFCFVYTGHLFCVHWTSVLCALYIYFVFTGHLFCEHWTLLYFRVVSLISVHLPIIHSVHYFSEHWVGCILDNPKRRHLCSVEHSSSSSLYPTGHGLSAQVRHWCSWSPNKQTLRH